MDRCRSAKKSKKLLDAALIVQRNSAGKRKFQVEQQRGRIAVKNTDELYNRLDTKETVEGRNLDFRAVSRLIEAGAAGRCIRESAKQVARKWIYRHDRVCARYTRTRSVTPTQWTRTHSYIHSHTYTQPTMCVGSKYRLTQRAQPCYTIPSRLIIILWPAAVISLCATRAFIWHTDARLCFLRISAKGCVGGQL